MTHTTGHGVRVCQFGISHGRCRCASRNVIRITCPTPLKCAEETGTYVPRHRRDDVE